MDELDFDKNMKVQYIVPKQLEHIKVSEKIINKILDDCEQQSIRNRVVLLGIYNGMICFSWEGDVKLRYAYPAIVTAVDKNGVIKTLNPLDSMKIIKKAISNGIMRIRE